MKQKIGIKVGVSPNIEGGETFIAVISKQAFARLESLQYEGGFLRYSIDLYNDNVKVNSYDTKWLKSWMKEQQLPV